MDENIANFIAFTGADADIAQAFLARTDGNIEEAVNMFLEQEEGGSHGRPVESSGPPPPSLVRKDPVAPLIASGTPVRVTGRGGGGNGGGNRGRVRTMRDVSGDGDDEDDDADGGEKKKKPDEFFVGGSDRSGVAVQPRKDDARKAGGDGPKGHYEDILEAFRGKESEMRERGEETVRPEDGFVPFHGHGYRLGSEESTSGHLVSKPKPRPKRFQLNLFSDGFTIDDGPLRNYTSPPNVQFMIYVKSGRTPPELQSMVEPGTPIEVDIREMGGKYEPPKPSLKAFTGSGRRLDPSGPFSSSSSSRSALGSNLPLSARPPPIDPSQPTTRIQIRLLDGSRTVGQFNVSNTVANVMYFAHSKMVSPTAFVLIAPGNIRLDDPDKTIEELRLQGTSLLQQAL